MAFKSQAFGLLGAVTGNSPATYAKIDRSLGCVGLSPRGGQGGGRNTNHLEVSYYRSLLLGLAAYLPSEAGEVVVASLGCNYLGSAFRYEIITSDGVSRSEPAPVTSPEVGPGSTLASYIDGRIEAFANEGSGTPQTMSGHPILIQDSLIRIDFDPFAAQVEWRAEGGLLLVHYFVPAQEIDDRRHLAPEDAATEMARVRRSSILPASLLFTAAGLLADGWAKRGKRLPFSGQGGATFSVTPETENAPGLAGPRASTRKNQPRKPRETGHPTTPETKRVCSDYQGHTGSRGLHL